MNYSINAFIFSMNVNLGLFFLEKMSADVNSVIFLALNMNVYELNILANVPNTVLDPPLLVIFVSYSKIKYCLFYSYCLYQI